MKKRRFAEEPIIENLREQEAGRWSPIWRNPSALVATRYNGKEKFAPIHCAGF